MTSSRNAKWWYSAFHNVTAMVGAGVLSLPYAMAELGWGPGVAVLVLSWIITLYTLWQMVEMHEMVPGKRFDRYHELAAAVMSLSYSTIAWAASAHKGVQENVQYGYKAKTTAGTVFGFFSALGDVAFAYAGHNVVLEIQATIPSTPERPSKGPMWKGVVVAYIVVALCYFPVALVGYWMFGNAVQDNILISLNNPKWLIALANMFVVIHVIGSYQIYAMPVFDMIETLLVKKLNFPPSNILRFVVRNVYVAFTMFVAITFPFFGGLLGFFGGFAFAPTTYFLPCVMWLSIYKPRKFGLSWWSNWVCIFFGLCLMILSPIGGLRQIILDAKTYKFYS
ncbi:putative amino acid transporter, transmembrane domain-containing protein [Lupinus albus]|uniref:Putative amino acid transporter, transmembrane domain-containing protein n=1 Tax=Lupinus albus TaxID=3870 RepID=A0A6A4PEG6_LUPAL|nr:putative amino acid transporter, transmembrane domain-containing protein [Lupinus albus]